MSNQYMKNNYNLSQEEIDQILAEINNQSQLSIFGIDPRSKGWELPPLEFKGEVPKSVCNHNFVHYQGLNESYEFCTVCDEKKR